MSKTRRAVLAAASTDPHTIDRFRALVWPDEVLGGHRLWVGAISSGGHGRFWIGERDGQDLVVIAHRFSWALAHHTLPGRNTVIEHLCDEPSCQNPSHLAASSQARNVQSWWNRRITPGSPLRDSRGAQGRAEALRDALLSGADIEAASAAGLVADSAQGQLF